MTTNSIQRIEKGWSGHFICASSCVFRRHTLFEYADVSREISFDSQWSIDQPWKEQEANDMHEAVVAEISAQLLSGNKYEDPDSL